MKMEPIVSSETSAIRTQTPGNYPKRNKLQRTISLQVHSKNCEKDFVSSCPSVRVGQFASHWMDFHEILYDIFFGKSVEKIQVSLKSDKNNGYFTWRPWYMFDHISFSSSWNEKCFRQKLYRKSKHTFYVPQFFPRKLCRLWDNVKKYTVEPDRPQMTIWRMRIACWKPKATDTRSECGILK